MFMLLLPRLYRLVISGLFLILPISAMEAQVVVSGEDSYLEAFYQDATNYNEDVESGTGSQEYDYSSAVNAVLTADDSFLSPAYGNSASAVTTLTTQFSNSGGFSLRGNGTFSNTAVDIGGGNFSGYGAVRAYTGLEFKLFFSVSAPTSLYFSASTSYLYNGYLDDNGSNIGLPNDTTPTQLEPGNSYELDVVFDSNCGATDAPPYNQEAASSGGPYNFTVSTSEIDIPEPNCEGLVSIGAIILLNIWRRHRYLSSNLLDLADQKFSEDPIVNQYNNFSEY